MDTTTLQNTLVRESRNILSWIKSTPKSLLLLAVILFTYIILRLWKSNREKAATLKIYRDEMGEPRFMKSFGYNVLFKISEEKEVDSIPYCPACKRRLFYLQDIYKGDYIARLTCSKCKITFNLMNYAGEYISLKNAIEGIRTKLGEESKK